MSWTALKASIDTILADNGTGDITAEQHRGILKNVVDAVGALQFKGIATPTTNPGTSDGEFFYITSEDGTYANLNSLVVADEIAVLYKRDGVWSKASIITISDIPGHPKISISEDDNSSAYLADKVISSDGSLSLSVDGASGSDQRLNIQFGNSLKDDLDADSKKISNLKKAELSNDALNLSGSLFENHPFNERENHLSEIVLPRAIKGVQLFGANKDKRYALRRISKNYSGKWNIQLKELATSTIVAYLSTSTAPTALLEVRDVPEYSGSGISAKVLIDWSELEDEYNWQDTTTGIRLSSRCLDDSLENRLQAIETDITDNASVVADIADVVADIADVVDIVEWRDDYHLGPTEVDLTTDAILDAKILNAENGYVYAIGRYYNAYSGRGDQILVTKKEVSTGICSWVFPLVSDGTIDYHRKDASSNNIEDITPVYFEGSDGTKIFVLIGYSKIAVSGVNGGYSADAELTPKQYISEKKYTYKDSAEIVVEAVKLLSTKTLIKKVGDTARLIKKWDAEKDLIIDFKETAYNGLITFNGVYLRDNLENEPQIYDDLTGMQNLNSAGSDNVGPYNLTPGGASFNEWTGGAHLSEDDEPDNTTWEEIISLDAVAKTIEIADVTDYPVPNSGEKHIIFIKEWNGSAYSTQGRYSYTGISGNTLTGVEYYYSGNLSSVVGIGDANPTKTVFVLTTAKTESVEYYLDSVKITADDVWYEGSEVVVLVHNTLWDANTKRANPNDSALWDVLMDTFVSYRINGGSIEISDYTTTKKVIDNILAYYGLQSTTALWREFMYFPEAVDSTKQIYASGATSGPIDTYPNCDKMLTISETDNIIQDLYLDINYGNPNEVALNISSPSTVERIYNPSKRYFRQISNRSTIASDTIFKWHGLHNYTKNISQNSNIFVYVRYFKGEKYLIIDLTDSLTFPLNTSIRVAELVSKDFEVVYKTSGITIEDESSNIVAVGAGGLNIAASNAGQIRIKLK